MAKARKLSATQKEKIAREFLLDKARNGAKSASFFSQNASSANRVFKGSRSNKHNEQWKIFNETADNELLGDEIEILRARCRQLGKDNPIAEGTIITFQEMAIGNGPFLRVNLPGNTDGEKRLNDFLQNWSYSIDATGEESLNDVCRNLVSNACDNGDVLVTLPMFDRPGIQTAVQLIEADRISTPSGMTSFPIRHGVQYNKITGEIDGYWVRNIGVSEDEHKYGYVSHPDRSKYTFYPRMKNGRLSAWLFKRPSAIKRPGQSRQTPLFSTCIHSLKQMEDLVDATVIGQRVAACIMGIIKSNDVEGIVDSITRDPSSGDRLEDKYGHAYSKMQPGTMIPLRAGEDFVLSNPQRNGQEIMGTLQMLARDVAMKTRIPYAILFLDLAAINYSSYRAGILEARKMLAGWRSNIAYRCIRPIVQTVITEGVLRGMIKGVDASMLPTISWPAWGFVDPTKEIDANARAIDTKQTSAQRIIAETGNDWEEIYEEIAIAKARELELEKKYPGIKMTPIAPGQAAPEPVKKEETPEDENGPKPKPE